MVDQTFGLFEKAVPIFNILQDKKRQEILAMLCKTNQMTVNQITEKVSLSRPAVSHHLKLMLNAGILKVSQVGTERYYSADLIDTYKLLKALTESLGNDLNK